jgi:hypothetical protein
VENTPTTILLDRINVFEKKTVKAGKSMKKLIPVVLATSLVLSFGANDALAKGKNKHNPKGPKSKAEQDSPSLSDIEGFWGQSTVEKMSSLGIIEGHADGSFQPNKPVTQQEAVIMVVRLLGLEDEAQERNEAGVTLPFKNKASISSWAHGYIDVALELGLIEANDRTFKGNKPASRMFVTSLMVKGLRTDFSEYENIELDFTDIAGLTAEEKLQLAIAGHEELAKGKGNKEFQPNKPVKRGEMAAFLERMLDQLEESDIIFNEHVKGLFSSIDLSSGKITISSQITNTANQKVWTTLTYSLADKHSIYYEGKKRSSFDLFKDGDKIELVLNKEGKVVFIQGASKKEDQSSWNQLQGVSEFKLELTSGQNKIHYSYDATKADDVYVLTQKNGQTTLLQENDAATAIKAMINTHFKEGTALNPKEVSRLLASQVLTPNQQEATVSVSYKTNLKDLQFIVDVKQTTNSISFSWAKGNATVNYTETKDVTGKVIHHLELKDTESHKEVSYHKEVVGATTTATGYIKLNGTVLTIQDVTLEPTINQLLAGYKLNLLSSTPVSNDQVVWSQLAEVANFNLQITAGQNSYSYIYTKERPSEIYVLLQKNGQSNLLVGNDAAVMIKTMIDTYFKANTQFDVKEASRLLATQVQDNAQQDSKVTLNYQTTSASLLFDVEKKANTEATTLTAVKGKVTTNYVQTKDTPGKVIT